MRWSRLQKETMQSMSTSSPQWHNHNNNNKKERQTCHKESNQINDTTLFFHWSVSKHNKQAGTLTFQVSIILLWVLRCTCKHFRQATNETRESLVGADDRWCSKLLWRCWLLCNVTWRHVTWSDGSSKNKYEIGASKRRLKKKYDRLCYAVC